MGKGFDCSSQLTAPVANMFKRDGYDFVCRYLVPDRFTKYLSKTEALNISAAGLQIISVYETTADRALSGYDGGKEDGAVAAQCAVAVGQPAGSCIYFAVDFEVTSEQMQTVIDYIRGCSEATPDYSTGVYGSVDVIRAVQAASVCSHYWQTYAWSRGERADYIQLYQYHNGNLENGVSIDLDESYGNEGWWNVTVPVPTAPTYPMTTEDANKLTAILGGIYAAEVGQDEAHRLANVVRKCAGLPEE